MPNNNSYKLSINAHHFLSGDKDILTEHAALYLTQAIRAFAIASIGIFLPIYIYIHSQEYLIFNNDLVLNGLVWGFLYFMLRSLGTLIFSSLLLKTIFSKIHLNRSMFLSLVIEIVEIVLWLLAAQNLYLMLLAGLLAGLKVTLFWIPYHIYFVRKFEQGSYGKNIGMRFLFEKFLTGFAPLFGGIIIATVGFEVLFVISILILLASALPILLTVHEWKHQDHSIPNILKDFVFNKRYKLLTISYIGEYIENSVYTIAWPVLLFLGIASFVKIGTLASVTTVISAFTAVLAGRAIDKHGTRLIHGIGVFFNTLLHIPRVFLRSALGLYVIDITDRLNSPLYVIPNISLSYEKAKRNDRPSDFIIYRELVAHSAITITCLILVFALSNLSVWRWIFLLAAFGSSLVYFVDLDRN